MTATLLAVCNCTSLTRRWNGTGRCIACGFSTVQVSMAPAEINVKNLKARNRRQRHREAGICINGMSHGPATHGVLCKTCRDVHKFGFSFASIRADDIREEAIALGELTIASKTSQDGE